MISFSDLSRETRFLIKQPYTLIFLAIVLALSVFSVWTGIAETEEQHKTIERLLEKDTLDRTSILDKKSDYGSAAYYSFHLTYLAPSPLAFAAMGQRDIYPWKHRIRMLALEGQIYETDADNPELSFMGRFDFAFLATVLMPLFVILLLHDVRSSESEAGRFDLLIVTAKNQHRLWTARVLVLSIALVLVLTIPLLVGAVVVQAPLIAMGLMALVTLGHLAFWVVITVLVGNKMAKRSQSSAFIASSLLSIWLVLAVIVPVVSDTLINKAVKSPNGGEVVLLQREAVNDAWDLPFSATWDAFLVTHPEWVGKTKMDSLFEWKWYYAFQQVGDQKAADLSNAYRDAIVQKDALAGMVSFTSPPMLTQRLMTAIANTDIRASLKYEQSVRDFHQSLRNFYYPLLFNDTEFDRQALNELPQFSPDS